MKLFNIVNTLLLLTTAELVQCSLNGRLGRLEQLQLHADQLKEELTNEWAVELLNGGAERASQLAEQYGLELLGQIGNLHNHFHYRLLEERESSSQKALRPVHDANALTDQLKLEPDVGYVERQVRQPVVKMAVPNDPQWDNQWSLSNTGQTLWSSSGRDLNVVPVWNQGITGQGVVVSIVDEGVDISHPDLTRNYDPAASYDFVHYDTDPTPERAGFGEEPNDHGTSCAGVVAMTRDNRNCGVGVAYNANLGGIKTNFSANTDARLANLLGFRNDYIDIYSNSFGPPDFGFSIFKLGHMTNSALDYATTNGRSGKGSIYVWAAGNGGQFFDSCASDDYSQSIYTISIGAADINGEAADYDEQCSAKMATTFCYDNRYFNSNSYNQVVAPGDSGSCKTGFTGTSAATPLAAGVLALALEANPELSWRDVQYLLAYTSDSSSLVSGEWSTNGRGLRVSHKFGFGAVDAGAMVTRARTWASVPQQLSQTVSGSSRSGTARHYSSLTINFDVSSQTAIAYLEHVVVSMSLSVRGYTTSYGLDDFTWAVNNLSEDQFIDWWLDPHPRRGDIKVDLRSPSGTVSHLLPYRELDFINDEGYDSWPFMSVHHWGEDPVGRWTLTVTFKSSSGYVYASGVQLQLYGVDITDPGIRADPTTELPRTTQAPTTPSKETTIVPPTTHPTTVHTTESTTAPISTTEQLPTTSDTTTPPSTTSQQHTTAPRTTEQLTTEHTPGTTELTTEHAPGTTALTTEHAPGTTELTTEHAPNTSTEDDPVIKDDAGQSNPAIAGYVIGPLLALVILVLVVGVAVGVVFSRVRKMRIRFNRLRREVQEADDDDDDEL